MQRLSVLVTEIGLLNRLADVRERQARVLKPAQQLISQLLYRVDGAQTFRVSSHDSFLPGPESIGTKMSPARNRHQFRSLYEHGFVRVAAAVPHVRPADPEFNADRTLALAHQGAQQGAALVVFPELGVSAYAIDDLLHQQALTD